MKKIVLCACLFSMNAFAATGDREMKEVAPGTVCVAKTKVSGSDKEMKVETHSCLGFKLLTSEEAKVSLSERKSKH